MDESAFQEYREESSDWFRRARSELVRGLIQAHRADGTRLELLEVGAGVGQNLAMLSAFGPVDATEINPTGQSAIRQLGVARALYEEPVPFALSSRYDVICALDVVEHIEDDRLALEWLGEHLRPGGILVTTVPAYQLLFSDHDRALHHFRRYTRRSFCAKLPPTLHVRTAAYFNHLLFPVVVAARAAWSLSRAVVGGGEVVKQKAPTSALAAAVLSRILDAELRLIRNGYRPPWGLSVYCVAERV